MSKTIRTKNITLINGNNVVQNHKIDYGKLPKVNLQETLPCWKTSNTRGKNNN